MLLAWGANAHGECCSGDNSERAEPRPRCVTGVLRSSLGHAPSVAAVACGKAYTLLLMASGDVYACGRGREGQLGVELTNDSKSTRQPLLISSLRPWRISNVSCGCNHSMAVSRCGKAFEWGLLMNDTGKHSQDSVASRVGGLGRDFTEDLSEREQRIIAESWSKYIMTDSSVQGDEAIALFQSQSCQRYPTRSPRPCTGLEGMHVRMICCGYAHSVALLDDGAMMAHGYNEKGQLGNGVRVPSQHFVRVTAPLKYEGDTRAATLSCGLNHNAAILKGEGELATWGVGTFGQLGLGHHYKETCKPGIVELPTGALGVACGDNHTIVLLKGGDVYAFGHRDALGGTSHTNRLPERVRSLRPGGVQSVYAGGNGSFVIVEDSDVALPESLHAWGYNQQFQLGRYTGELQLVIPGPTSVPRLPGMSFKLLDAGMYHCLAILDTPTVSILPPHLGDRCFGSSALWQMLDGEVEYDVSVKVSDAEPLGAHRCVLAARCPSLAARIQKVNAIGCSLELDMGTHRSSTMEAMLEYLYCDYCRAAPDVAACLTPLADEFSLPRLAAGVTAATHTGSIDSGVGWVRTAGGKWAQVAADAVAQVLVPSTYIQDLLQLVQVEDVDPAIDFVKLCVSEVGSTKQRSICVARPLLLASNFFRALLEGGFAECQNLRSGVGHLEVSADNADALVLCLQVLASGKAYSSMPYSCEELLAVMVEAHRLSFPDAFNAAELALSKLVEGGLGTAALEAIACVAKLYDLERLVNEVERYMDLKASSKAA